jgi:dTDP-4-amino-4,6-dideoxygalactose transaminase
MKSRPEELALAGGVPAFAEPLHVGRPNIGDRARLLARINDMLDRRWLTNDGRYVREFEAQVASATGTRHAVATCNATLALQLAARAVELRGEIILPSFTFIATAHALSWIGLTPVFCDVDERTHNLDPERVEACITPRTTGILGVHLWGRPCDVDALAAIARRHGLSLLFDAAHALGASRAGVPIGGFGRCEIASFHATKMINSFEGGAVLTNDGDLADRVRRLRNFGFTGLDTVAGPGINAKMSEASAAMGLTNFESREAFVATNRARFEDYQAGLRGVPGITLMSYDPADTPLYHHIVVEVDQNEAGISRDVLWRTLWAENVRARRYFYPGCHRQAPYRRHDPDAAIRLPATEALASRILVLPGGSSLSAGDVRSVCSLIALACAAGAALLNAP